MIKTSDKILDEHVVFQGQPSKVVGSVIETKWIILRVVRTLFRVALKEVKQIPKAVKITGTILERHFRYYKTSRNPKMVRIDGRYFWSLVNPGWPSRALERSLKSEVLRVLKPGAHQQFNTLLLNITRKCPLNCAHCFEWDRLNQRESLSRDDLVRIVQNYQEYGGSVVLFGGGEPMLRIKDMCHVIRQANRPAAFWTYTSGFNLGPKQARLLKGAGLTGVIVSLDHFEPEEHNKFRGSDNAFNLAVKAILACHEAKLGTMLAVCTTREFTTEKNVVKYLELARKLGVHFVQFLEPKAAGRYAGQDVLLDESQKRLLEKMVDRYNHKPGYRKYPVILYPECVIRKVGCTSGDRVIFINSAGMIQQCPFCDQTLGHADDYPVPDALKRMRQMPCADYAKQTL